ncbi:tRNA preQ1(34) S-adenosylmethionine ribosyltransferase-isomerase QueA [Actinomarinicola tropica]|uniref:S-adenosylmethionine:tRNA ribosyltransferase-isomerase n=1 Tax=Actinomarinicola tropica TaxID=2789776 RepID=A0A5Q2RJR5_9ACTN|nr:tRNA preQ1(34) S-adenosylmethionine ribosyltransferase-isomerase QueA [Actinomarinicola tropica]QGG95152.1 tRNA preQ1(34) S-adenosylmethionine ribosyltransferase-isomerase QueA [Actinomarinicola tropica]
MDLADVDYDLPPERIAQRPVEPRDAARLLVDEGPGAAPRHLTVADLPSLVGPGDVIVVNDTRVLPARLLLRKPTGGEVEVLLLEPSREGWEALVRPSRKVRPGTVLSAADGADDLQVEVGEDLGEGRRRIRLIGARDEMSAIERHGRVPLPPYIHEALDDPERYQTVYADRPASVAAPTAGLHLTPRVLDACVEAGARIERVELVVGIGTFRPITAEKVEDHVMHAETYRVPAETVAACEGAQRVVAIGTTTVRALESAAATGELEGRTEIFIHGDHPWRTVDLMLTNFHVPRSSLLVMIESFVGRRWRGLYETALEEGYRFLSFGDAMLLRRGGRS